MSEITLGGVDVQLPTQECQTDPGDNTCTASVAGHRCKFDNGDLDHFVDPMDDDTPWLVGVRHCCGCHPTAACWPEVY